MKALIIGATGATGKDLTEVLLHDPAYTEVAVFVRKKGDVQHPKLTEIVTDFSQLENVAEHIKGDVWFSLLGTTLKTAGSKEKQWTIDYDIPVAFAEIAKRNAVERAVLLSAYGASATSRIFYSKMKGMLEEKLDSIRFNQYIIFKPGLLLRKKTDRFGERISGAVLKFLNTIGVARKFRPMPTSVLAEKMATAPKNLPGGKHTIALNNIFRF